MNELERVLTRLARLLKGEEEPAPGRADDSPSPRPGEGAGAHPEPAPSRSAAPDRRATP